MKSISIAHLIAAIITLSLLSLAEKTKTVRAKNATISVMSNHIAWLEGRLRESYQPVYFTNLWPVWPGYPRFITITNSDPGSGFVPP